MAHTGKIMRRIQCKNTLKKTISNVSILKYNKINKTQTLQCTHIDTISVRET